jgi:hypothetical protein
MPHNLHGDIPESHKKLAKELLELESYFDSKEDAETFVIAKGYLCIAHDWYEMGDDDKGSDLLLKANEACPGYFDKEMHKQMVEDPDFDYLVKNLTGHILEIVRSIVGQKKC